MTPNGQAGAPSRGRVHPVAKLARRYFYGAEMTRRRSTHLFRSLSLATVVLLAFIPVAGAQADGPVPPPTPDWATPKRFAKVAPHPRLYVSAAQLRRAVEGRGEDYAAAYDQIERAALTGLREAGNPMPEANMMRRQIWIVGRLSAMALRYFPV